MARFPLYRGKKVVVKPQEVRPIRRVLTDEVEVVALAKGRLTFPQRGNIGMMQVLSQVYDTPNVVALDLLLGEKELTDIRKLDADLERRMRAMVGSKLKTSPLSFTIRVRLTAVFG